MYMLVLQTFLLMMAAFLVGATLACLLKRTVHRFTADDIPEDALRIDVPPAVQRSEGLRPAATPPVPVTREDAARFERALKGDVAEVAPVAVASVGSAGPVIEVQPLPVPPPVTTVPDYPPPPIVVSEAQYAGPTEDSAAAPEGTYTEIAVASHDGSMLPPPGVVEAELPPPQMPGPTPAPLPIPTVEVPTFERPADAPGEPDPNYIAEALASGAVFQPQPEEEVPEFELSAPGDPNDFSVPPEGETYASIAVGEIAAPAASTATAPALVPDASAAAAAPDTTGITHATAALAAAAGIAAGRAAGQLGDGQPDDLTRIHGIDDVLAARLNYSGVTQFAQIAAWNADDVHRMSQTIGFFGRIEDEYWIDQARLLVAEGDESGSESSRADATNAPDADEPERKFGRHATSAAAADMATAAAAAAAAAMIASTQRPDAPLRPAKLADAIRENAGQSDEGADVGALADDEDSPESGGRSLTGLRSVRAGALLGDDAEYVRGNLDDLKRIRGIGVLIEKKLNSLGITSYEQVANWSVTEVERISEILDFKGRIERENWIEQARILASGGQTEFSRRVDRGEV